MERLTARNGLEVRYIGKHGRAEVMDDAATMRVAARREVLHRLAEYEDTGLTPEQIAGIMRPVQDITGIKKEDKNNV